MSYSVGGNTMLPFLLLPAALSALWSCLKEFLLFSPRRVDMTEEEEEKNRGAKAAAVEKDEEDNKVGRTTMRTRRRRMARLPSTPLLKRRLCRRLPRDCQRGSSPPPSSLPLNSPRKPPPPPLNPGRRGATAPPSPTGDPQSGVCV